ncbi:ras-related protein Rab-8A-like [Littorina saxatilis]|uniref:Uncharacterized protein n=1 Tax=Littorina saxatilis TaxID=31220 RepID=A0AAN9G1S8_9CAEN
MSRNEEKRNDYAFTIVLGGNTGVGKTCLLSTYVTECFPEIVTATIGADFKTRTIDIDGKHVKLTFFDIAGPERFRTYVGMYARQADAIVLVYDVTNWQSFESIREWRQRMDHCAKHKVRRMLVGNKCDLTSRRVVSLEEGRELAATTSMMHMETSAKTYANLEALFSDLVRNLIATSEPGK